MVVKGFNLKEHKKQKPPSSPNHPLIHMYLELRVCAMVLI